MDETDVVYADLFAGDQGDTDLNAKVGISACC